MNDTSDLRKIIGHRLQMVRVEKALTQEQMGEKLHLSTSAYCKLEYGETDLTLTRLNQIAEALEIAPVELFCKVNGNVNYNNSNGIGTNNTVTIGNGDDLKELIKSNSRLIDMLCRRIDNLEDKIR